MDTGNITLNFTHPTNSGDVLTATVSPAATPRYLIDQMVKNEFLPTLGTGAQYKLLNTATAMQLLDNVPLQSAGVATGTTLAVEHTTTGA